MPINVSFDRKLHYKPPHFSNDRVHFFKYVTAEVAKLILQNRTVRFTKPTALNDVFDMQPDFAIPLLKAEMIKEIGEYQWKIYNGYRNDVGDNPFGKKLQNLRKIKPNISRKMFMEKLESETRDGYLRGIQARPQIEKQIQSQLNGSKIFCMTTSPLIRQMWSHYSDKYCGVVLRFRSIPAFDSFLGSAKKIHYVEKMPLIITNEDLVKLFSGLALENYEEQIDHIIYTKHLVWIDEDEWRVILPNSENPKEQYEDKHFHENELDGVFFGLKTPEKEKETIVNLAKNYPNVSFFQTGKIFGSYDLEVVEHSIR